MEVVVTTGATSRAKLQSNHHHQHPVKKATTLGFCLTSLPHSLLFFWRTLTQVHLEKWPLKGRERDHSRFRLGPKVSQRRMDGVRYFYRPDALPITKSTALNCWKDNNSVKTWNAKTKTYFFTSYESQQMFSRLLYNAWYSITYRKLNSI